ncbi:hypothetical protein AB0K86_26130 [Streptomyces clavifer]|uniref:hypothetical protein n=1 Tax=Streptomyces TaxID=1883 RepID=UPI001F5B76FE|nr:hypothetical protein [Streptomyces sp. Root55]
MTDDNEELCAADLIGRRLLKVTTARLHYADDEPPCCICGFIWTGWDRFCSTRRRPV